MEFKDLTRDRKRVLAAVKQTGDTLVALQDIKIYVPEAYKSGVLANITDKISIIGIFGMILDERYFASTRIIGMVTITPSTTNVVDIDGTKYMEFGFFKGDTIIPNMALVVQATLIYPVYNNFIANGNITPFMDYADVGFIFDTALRHAGANLNADSALLELLSSVMARNPSDRTKHLRHTVKTQAEADSTRIAWIGVSDVAYQVNGSVAKISGAYFNNGLTSALTTESTETSSIEDLLRK